MKITTKRILDVDLPSDRSAFLWDPRKTGKTYWIDERFKDTDIILGDMDVAIEVKGSQKIHSGHTKSLSALMEEHSIGRTLIVSMEKQPRKIDHSIEVLPWKDFLEILWSGGLGV
jgi:predicted AAA+ superfamily ATPase